MRRKGRNPRTEYIITHDPVHRDYSVVVAKRWFFKIKISQLCNRPHNYNSVELLIKVCFIRSTLNILCTFYFYPFLSDNQTNRSKCTRTTGCEWGKLSIQNGHHGMFAVKRGSVGSAVTREELNLRHYISRLRLNCWLLKQRVNLDLDLDLAQIKLDPVSTSPFPIRNIHNKFALMSRMSAWDSTI